MKVRSKIVILVLIILVIVGSVIVLLLSPSNEKGKNDINVDNQKEENYIAFISINPLVKLDFKIECKNDNCDEPIITNYELVNEDAKEIYKDIDFKDRKLKDVLELLNSIAKDNNINNEYIDIYTDWKDSINYITNNSKDYQYKINHLETEELRNKDFEEELESDPYIIVEVEIPSSVTVKSCNHRTKLVYNSEFDGAFACGPSEYCGYITKETHPDMWKGFAYACLLEDVNGCAVKVPFYETIIKVKIRTKQSIYDNFKNNKCYELTYDKYCACKDSYVKAEFDRDHIDEVGKHKVNATIKSSQNIEILPFEKGVPYIEFELGINENYEQEQSKCLSAGIGTTVPLPSCSE